MSAFTTENMKNDVPSLSDLNDLFWSSCVTNNETGWERIAYNLKTAKHAEDSHPRYAERCNIDMCTRLVETMHYCRAQADELVF